MFDTSREVRRKNENFLLNYHPYRVTILVHASKANDLNFVLNEAVLSSSRATKIRKNVRLRRQKPFHYPPKKHYYFW